jgi:hypothetical protein
MRDPLLGWHLVGNSSIDGYNVVKQTHGKRQRYAIYEEANWTSTRIARDLKPDDARGVLKILLASASND